MTRLRRHTLAVAAAALLAAAPVFAAAPLEGEAWRLADRAYASYEAGQYEAARRDAEAAIALRPDVERLRLLLVYTLQKQGRRAQALAAIDAAERSGVRSAALREARANLRQPAAAPGAAASSAYQRAFPIATRAYEDYNAGRYEAAARGAETALRTDPGQGAWALLWLDALEAQGRLEQAEEAAATALALGAPNTDDLAARRQTLRRRMAVAPAEAAYQALIANRYADAAKLAARAVALDPDPASHRLLLVTALMLDERFAEAEAAATQALAHDDEDTVALVMRAYLRQRQGRGADAAADFDQALAQDWLDDDQRRHVALIAADAALAGGDPARALALVAELPADDELARRRREAARRGAAPAAIALAPPVQSCRDTPYGTTCELLPWDAPGSGGAATLAYAAYGRGEYDTAIVHAREAYAASPEDPAIARLLVTALSAGSPAQMAEADQRLAAMLAEAPGDAGLLMQRGYLQQRMGRPDLAADSFAAARATGEAPATAVLDHGYALAGAGDKPAATAAFRQALDAADAGALSLDANQRFNTRAAISDLTREWGATLSVGYRGSRPAVTGLGGAAITTPGDAVFSTAEVYWRPPQLDDRHGRLEVYGRAAHTLHDGGSRFESRQFVDPCTGAMSPDERPLAERVANATSATGWPSTVGSLGLRYTLRDTGFTFGLERRFLLGSATRRGYAYPASAALQCELLQDDQRLGVNSAVRYELDGGAGGWLGYVSYGFYDGTGIRFDTPSWWTVEGYVQAGYVREDNRARFSRHEVDAAGNVGRELAAADGRLARTQTFAAAEVRAGRSFRLDRISNRLVAYPYLVAGADWISQRDTARAGGLPVLGGERFRLSGERSTWALGAGVGVNLRWWLREDHYHAPRSYLDATVQYRFHLGGGQADRAEGLFLNLTLSY